MRPRLAPDATALDAAREAARCARTAGLHAEASGIPALGALLAAGPDAVGFLQTQLTSDVSALAPGDDQPTARLTRSGGLVAHGVLFRLPERGQPFPSYLFLVERSEASALLADLEASHVAEEVSLEDASEVFEGLLVQGPRAGELRPLARETGGFLVDRSWTGDPGWLLLWPRGRLDVASIRGAADERGLLDLDRCADADTVWGWLLLEAGRPRPGVDFEPGRTILPSTGLEQHVVSTTKGCYRGQEVVARVRTYGSVPRALRGLLLHEPLNLDPTALPAPGGKVLTVEDETIGRWASGGYSATHDRVVALAYLDRNHRTPGLRLQLQAGDLDLEAEVAALPLYASTDDAERAAELYARALRRFQDGSDREAVSLLEEAIGLDPGLKDAYEVLGVILGRGELYHEAIDVFQRLAEVAPEEPMVHTNLSLFYMKVGDKEEAERQKALATVKRFGGEESDEARAIREAGEADGRRDDALRRRDMFGEVLAADPRDGLALMGLGTALLDLEEYAAAAELLERALEAQPENSALYLSCGKALQHLDRRDEACAVYRRGVETAARKGDFLPLKELEHRLFLLENATD